MKNIIIGLSIVVALAALPQLTLAQERGRLADGRAYRTDSQGNQLVDYIAELEVTVATQERQIQGLSDELERANSIIKHSSFQKGTSQQLGERDLLQPESAGSVTPTNVEQPVVDCADEVSQYEKLLAAERSAWKETELTWRRENRKYKDKVASYQLALASLRSELDRKKAAALASSKVIEPKKSATTEAGEELFAEAPDLQAPQVKPILNIEPVEQERLVEAGVEKKVVVAKVEDAPRYSYRASTIKKKEKMSPAKRRAIQSFRAQGLTKLNRLNSQIRSRDNAFRRLDQSSLPVKFELSELISDEGKNVAAIKKGLQRASSITAISRLQGEIKEIESLVKEDIALIRRMSQ